MSSKHAFKKAISELRRHRGVCDVHSYGLLVDEHTVLHRDGALSSHFLYRGPDVSALSDTDCDFVATTWKNAFGFLGDGWMVEANVISQRLCLSGTPPDYPDVISALIAKERQHAVKEGAYFTSRFYLSLTYKSARFQELNLKRFVLQPPTKDTQEDDFEKRLLHFSQTVSEFIQYLSRAVVSIRALEGRELTTFLHQALTGTEGQLALPRMGTFLNTYVASEDFIAGFVPQMGKRHIVVLALDDLPNVSYPGFMEFLSHLPLQYRFASRYIPLSQRTAKSYLKRYYRNWSSKAIGLWGVIRGSLNLPVKVDVDAQETADALEEALTENSAQRESYGFYTAVLVLMHEDKTTLETITEEVRTHIQQRDFKVRTESVNATEAFLGSLPGHGDYNCRKSLVEAQLVSHGFPTTSVYSGEVYAPCPLMGYQGAPALLLTTTEGQRPFHLNCHVGDVGHTAILGPTGSGKTTLIGALMAAHRQYSGSRIIVLDKDYSNRFLIKALGGAYIDVVKGECSLAPLSRVSRDNPTSIEQAIDWLASCCFVQGVDVTAKRLQLLREAILRLADAPAHTKTLSDVVVQDPELRSAISIFSQGQYEKLLGGSRAGFPLSDVVGIEMSGLLARHGSGRELHIPLIKALFQALEATFSDKRPTLLILEEAWLYLRHPLFQAKLADWFKTLRKANVAVILVSQDLDDIVKSQAASTIQSSCMTRLYLPNFAASEPNIAAQYEAFGLTKTQIRRIKEATPKRDYYYHSPLGERLLSLELGPLAKAFLCVSSKADLEKFDAVFEQDNSAWVFKWLEYKGLSQWCEFVKSRIDYQE